MNTINLTALAICIKQLETSDIHQIRLDKILENLPNGSGIDEGIQLDYRSTKPDKIVFVFSYHHMDENGYYDGWTDHKLIITPSFGNYSIRITGRDRNNLKDYLYDMFYGLFTVTDYKTAQNELKEIMTYQELKEQEA